MSHLSGQKHSCSLLRALKSSLEIYIKKARIISGTDSWGLLRAVFKTSLFIICAEKVGYLIACFVKANKPFLSWNFKTVQIQAFNFILFF